MADEKTSAPATSSAPAPARWHLEWSQVAALACVIAGLVMLAVFAPESFAKLLELLGNLNWEGIIGAGLIAGGVGAMPWLPQLLRRLAGAAPPPGDDGGAS